MDAQARCRDLRRRLESLRAFGPLEEEHFPLVQRLLEELELTAKSLPSPLQTDLTDHYSLRNTHTSQYPRSNITPFTPKSPQNYHLRSPRVGKDLGTDLQTRLNALEAQKLLDDSEIARLKYDFDRAKRLKGDLDSENQYLEDENRRLKLQLDSEIETRQQIQTLQEAISREVDQLRRENEQMRAKDTDQREEMLQLTDLKTKLAATSQRVRVLEREFSNFPQKSPNFSEFINEIATLRSLLQAKDKEIAAFRESPELQRLRNTLNNAQQETETLTERVVEQQRAIDQLEIACEKAEIDLQRCQNSEKDTISRLRTLQEQLETSENERKLLEKSLQTAQRAAEAEKSQVHQLLQANSHLEELLTAAETQKQALSAEIEAVQMKSVESEQELIKALKSKEDELEASLSQIARFKEEQRTIREFQEQISELEQEKDHLQLTYEAVCRSERVSQQLLKTIEKEKDGLKERLEQPAEQEELYRKLEDSEARIQDLEDLLAQYQAQLGPRSELESELVTERKKVQRLEAKLKEQKGTEDEGASQHVRSSSEAADLHAHIEEQREEILTLEMEVMQLRDELGRSQHLQFKAESKVRELERQFN